MKALTDTELEMMKTLWKLGEGSVSDVQKNLAPQRQLAYTSISTILRILEQKQIVKPRKEGRGHIYVPCFSQQEYEAFSTAHFVDNVFDQDPSRLVRHLVQNKKLNADELARIKALIEEAQKR